jgi:hypothetical protein
VILRRTRRRGAGWAGALAVGLLLGLTATTLRAQVADSVRAGVTRQDLVVLDSGARTAPSPVEERPPISPRRAFLYSFVLPGAGQAQLDRAYAGGFFVFVEITALALIHRSAEDLRIARAFRGDSMPLSYQIDPITGVAALDTLGNPIVTQWSTSRYSDAWIRTRRLHLEDWMAVLVFNHLFSGADAYVAAQLWDLPAKVSLRTTPNGPALTASFSFR